MLVNLLSVYIWLVSFKMQQKPITRLFLLIRIHLHFSIIRYFIDNERSNKHYCYLLVIGQVIAKEHVLLVAYRACSPVQYPQFFLYTKTTSDWVLRVRSLVAYVRFVFLHRNSIQHPFPANGTFQPSGNRSILRLRQAWFST